MNSILTSAEHDGVIIAITVLTVLGAVFIHWFKGWVEKHQPGNKGAIRFLQFVDFVMLCSAGAMIFVVLAHFVWVVAWPKIKQMILGTTLKGS